MPTFLVPIIIVAFIAFIVSFIYMIKRYRRCPPDKILVIFGAVGKERSFKCIHGGSAFVMPLYQDYTYLSLTPMETEVNILKCFSNNKDFCFNIKANFTFAIGTEEHLMNEAATKLLNLSINDIEDLAKEIIYGQLRLSIASFSPDDLRKENEKFLDAVKANIEPELNKIGLKLINIFISELEYCKDSN